MALPTSGQITLAQIRDEVSPGTTSNVSLRALSSAAGFSTPDTFSEFYGYSAMTPPSISYPLPYSVTGVGTVANPYSITLSSNSVNLYSDGSIYMFEMAYFLKFESQTAGAYRIHLNVTSRNLPGLTDASNGFYLFFNSPWNAIYYGVERGAGSDSALAAINLPDEVGQQSTIFNVGSDIAYMQMQIYNTYFFTFNSLTFTVGFELI